MSLEINDPLAVRLWTRALERMAKPFPPGHPFYRKPPTDQEMEEWRAQQRAAEDALWALAPEEAVRLDDERIAAELAADEYDPLDE